MSTIDFQDEYWVSWTVVIDLASGKASREQLLHTESVAASFLGSPKCLIYLVTHAK